MIKYNFKSLLFVPGHNKDFHIKSSKSNADCILLDLEDSVYPENNKLLARKIILESLNENLFKNHKVFIRINDQTSDYFFQDVSQLSSDMIDGFLLPKTQTAGDVIFFDKLLSIIERDKNLEIGKLKIIPILETAQSIVNADEIAKSSTRIIALGFGSEDFVSDISGIRDFGEDNSIFYPRAKVAIVARANDLIPIDAAYINVHDNLGIEKHLTKGKTLGYEAMWVLNPKQVDIVNRFYSPADEEIANAKKILNLYEQAGANNQGVAIIDGVFIGPPLVIKAKKILERAKLL